MYLAIIRNLHNDNEKKDHGKYQICQGTEKLEGYRVVAP